MHKLLRESTSKVLDRSMDKSNISEIVFDSKSSAQDLEAINEICSENEHSYLI